MKSFYLIFCVLISFFAANSAGAQEQLKLESLSDEGTFRVEMIWIPDDIGSDNTFSIRFIEPETNLEIEDIEYSLVLSQGDSGIQELRRVDQTATQQKIRFAEQGSYNIMIDDIDGLGEGASFSIQVTPEFPAGTVAIIGAGIAAMLISARRNRNDLFRLGTR
ncbi:MAG: hypothetical protein MN733_19125 [Nitrososphaera sp.]|nr:hypothetical protein [Nitrososphaera sp.]